MIYRFGSFELDDDRYLLRRGGKTIEAEPRVVELLAYLVRHRSRGVGRDELVDRVWKKVVGDGAVTRAIAEIRRLLDDDSGDPRWIETVYGRGYLFIGEVDERPDAPSAARDAVRRARELLAQDADHSIRMARSLFQRAVQIDPGSSSAWAGLADTLVEADLYRGEDCLEEALDASRRAVDLAPDSAEARTAQANVLAAAGRYREAEDRFREARELDPAHFDAHYLHARLCWSRGEMERAAELLEQASAVRPRDFRCPALLVQAYRGLGWEERRLEAARRGRDLALAHLEEAPGDTRALCLGAQCLLALGESERADELARRALEIDPEQTCTLYNLACLDASKGEIDRAFDTLRRAIAAGYRDREWAVHDPDLEPLREDARWAELSETMERSRS